jgi:predicted nuclease of predicted toxin-antitoxin system
MKFLADENFPGPAVQALRSAGFEVAWVLDDAPGSTDEAVLDWCRNAGMLLLTMDKDFGELVFRRGMQGAPGVLLFRAKAGSSDDFAVLVLEAVRSRSDWTGHFSVVSATRIRMTRLPELG